MAHRWTVSLDGGPRRVNHSAVLVKHKIFMFGGYCMGEVYEQRQLIDIHVLNTYNYRWMRVPTEITHNNGISNVPYMRYGHASVAIDDDAYVWGGRNDMEGACNKLFIFHTGNLQWQLQPTAGECPAARDGHAMCVVRGNIFVFGGYEEEGGCYSNEMYVLDIPTYTWHFIQPRTGNIRDSWRDFHTCSAVGEKILVFGGRSDMHAPYHTNLEYYDNVLKVFDTTTMTWSEPANPHTPLPLGRRSHSAFVHRGSMYIFGGYNSEKEKHFNDVWKFDPETNTWSEVAVKGKPPVPRRRQCCCLLGDRVFIFGGTGPRTTATSSGQWNLERLEDQAKLLDHEDLHVLDLAPSLKTLCELTVIEHDLDTSCLPVNIRSEIMMQTTPNTISSHKQG